jgi:hypothetical protein
MGKGTGHEGAGFGEWEDFGVDGIWGVCREGHDVLRWWHVIAIGK